MASKSDTNLVHSCMEYTELAPRQHISSGTSHVRTKPHCNHYGDIIWNTMSLIPSHMLQSREYHYSCHCEVLWPVRVHAEMKPSTSAHTKKIKVTSSNTKFQATATHSEWHTTRRQWVCSEAENTTIVITVKCLGQLGFTLRWSPQQELIQIK